MTEVAAAAAVMPTAGPAVIKTEQAAAPAAVAALLAAAHQRQATTTTRTRAAAAAVSGMSDAHSAMTAMQQQQQQQFQLQFQQQFLPQQHGGVGVAGGQLQPQYLPYMQMGGMSMSGGQQRTMMMPGQSGPMPPGQPMMMVAAQPGQLMPAGMQPQMMAWPQMQSNQMMATPQGMVMMGPNTTTYNNGAVPQHIANGGYPPQVHYMHPHPAVQQRNVQGDTSGGSSPRPSDVADPDIIDEDRPSYAELAYKSIEAAMNGKASVFTMYKWVEANYPDVPKSSDPPDLWKSRMRHALSSKPYFVHTTDENNDHAWTITKGSRPNFNVPRRPRGQSKASTYASSYNGGADTVVVKSAGMEALLMAAGAGTDAGAGGSAAAKPRAKPGGAPRSSKKKKSSSGVRKQSASAAAKAAAKKKNPKRPLTAYTCFVSEVRPQLMATHPTKSFKIVAAMIGKMWKELPEDGRAPYRRRAEMDMERFRRQKAAQDAEEGGD